MKKLCVIYRYCDKEIPATGIPRTKNFGTKKDILYKCMHSLMHQLQSFRLYRYKDIELELHTVEDPTKDAAINRELNTLVSHLINSYDSQGLVNKYKHHILNVGGNAASIGYTLDLGYQTDSDAIFFCEDDYLFDNLALGKMIEGYRELSTFLNTPVCIHPTDYIDRYTRTPLKPCHILLSTNSHWRTVTQTTGTVMMPKKVLVANWQNITKFRHYQILPNCTEDETINTTYTQYPCFSPIPTLAHHVQYKELLSPFYDLEFKRIYKHL